ncbi:MAG TPA: response regulator [Ktedonobacteraceae bacterium]|jgi:CheY-like chemotaxis protein|nr:response regulator [Ktedonobacteraceae bacterium]
MQKGSHILVVNDDQSLLDLYRMVLESEGYVVKDSLIAFEEITEVEQMRPDLIILDAKLGYHYEGLLFLQKLKLYPGTRHIPVMVCTAATREMREQQETLQQKGIPLLYKPFELDELLALIEQMLAASEEGVALARGQSRHQLDGV